MKQLRNLPAGSIGPALVILLSIMLVASIAINFLHPKAAYSMDSKTAVKPGTAVLSQLQDAFTSASEDILPSVVSITSRKIVTLRGFPGFDNMHPFGIPGMPNLPSEPQERPEEGYGTGVIVRENGYILTNDHVVGDADSVTIALSDGRTFEGKVLRDPSRDLALVKIDAKGLTPAKMGDSSKVKVGSWAIAIGSPFGLDQTVTVGVISAVGRQASAYDGNQIRPYPNLLQTDASINPGNSGGPLINIQGEVIGINTLIRSSSGGNEGIGFAIPINSAKRIVDQLIKEGKVTRGFLGIIPENLNPVSAERFGVKEGAFVRSVSVGTPADKAGIQVEDIIIKLDGRDIENEFDLRDAAEMAQPGKTVPIVIVRDKKQMTLSITVGAAPEIQTAQNKHESEAKLGFVAAELTPQLAREFGISSYQQGVVVTQVSQTSSAARAGLRPGVIINRINDSKVNTLADMQAITKGLKSRDTVRMIVTAPDRRELIEFILD